MTLRLFHVTRRAVFDGVEVHEGFVGDHAGEGQSVGRRFSGVIIAAEKVRVVFDGEDLFEEGEPVEDGGGAAAGPIVAKGSSANAAYPNIYAPHLAASPSA